MNQFNQKQINQAVLVANINPDYLLPISTDTATSLIPLVNVPVLDYALEALNRSGIEEVFIYANDFVNDIREHVRNGIKFRCSWSVKMNIRILGGDNFGCLGDALRDLYSTSTIQGDFVLMSTDTVTNASFAPQLQAHKKRSCFDKGTAMTIIFKEASTGLRSGDEVMIAMDAETKRLHHYQRIKTDPADIESKFEIPLEVFLVNSEITLHHNLLDPQIAICSPIMLALFTDNFDFQTREDFIRGLLINEEILDSRIYVSLLPKEQYARKAATNWQTYQIVSNDIINRWVYPLVPDMGICSLWQHYLFLRNNVYKSPAAIISKVKIGENVVIKGNSEIDNGSDINATVIGSNCRIGKNCTLKNAFIFDGVIIEDNCSLSFCVIGRNARISQNCELNDSVLIGSNTVIPPNTKLSEKIVQSSQPEDDDEIEKIGPKAYIVDDIVKEYVPSDSEFEDIDMPSVQGIPKVKKLEYCYVDSDYNSSCEYDGSEGTVSPIQEDTNIFLSEVVDSLTRGFNEKSNPDFLILEINSSRYAYNMTLNEVNFLVVKAIFSLEPIKTGSNPLIGFKQVVTHLLPVIKNYIKHEDAMQDCLNAVEESCSENENLKSKAAQLIHYLYDKEIVSEDAILKWHENFDDESEWLRKPLKKLIDWLMASSEEDE